MSSRPDLQGTRRSSTDTVRTSSTSSAVSSAEGMHPAVVEPACSRPAAGRSRAKVASPFDRAAVRRDHRRWPLRGARARRFHGQGSPPGRPGSWAPWAPREAEGTRLGRAGRARTCRASLRARERARRAWLARSAPRVSQAMPPSRSCRGRVRSPRRSPDRPRRAPRVPWRRGERRSRPRSKGPPSMGQRGEPTERSRSPTKPSVRSCRSPLGDESDRSR